MINIMKRETVINKIVVALAVTALAMLSLAGALLACELMFPVG